MSDSLLAGSTNVVELTAFQDTVTDTYPADATVTCDILDENNQVVSGGGGGVIMDYVAPTTGPATTYRGLVPAAAALIAGKLYTRRITAVGAGGTGTRIFTKEIVATSE
jgi:hypothetical protein